MKQIFHNFLFFLQVQCSIAHVLLTWLDISHFYPLNNTLQWAVTFRSFSHISPLCNKWSRSHSITAWIASEMHSTLTKIRKLEIFSRTWYTMSWTLKWASSGKVCVAKGCSWSWGCAAWPLVRCFKNKWFIHWGTYLITIVGLSQREWMEKDLVASTHTL